MKWYNCRKKVLKQTARHIPPPFIAAHPLHRSSWVAYPLRDASTADVKTVKVERISLQNILSSNHTAYCLQIKLYE